MSAPHFHRLTIADLRRETKDAVSIAFAVPPELASAYAFEPGQYLTLRATLQGEEERRSYSICSGLDDGELRVAVKKVDGGRFSTHVNEALKPGDTLDVMTPMGRFTAPPDRQGAACLSRHRLRLGDHAGDLAHQIDFVAREAEPLRAALWQPFVTRHHVQGRARGSEGQPSRPARRPSRALARGAGFAAAPRAPRCRKNHGPGAGKLFGKPGSIMPSSAGRKP